MFGRIAQVFALAVLLATFSFAQVQPQPVWTWHNDNNRTGQQLGETQLTPNSLKMCNNSPNCFGWIWKLSVAGQVYAQPLAIGQLTTQGCNPTPCNVLFVATEEDMLYAFNSDSTTQLWSIDLAGQAGGTYVDCTTLHPPCDQKGVIFPYIGVTGTPVIDISANLLYVVTVVELPAFPGDVEYFLHAIDIKKGQEAANSPIEVTASVTGASTFPKPCWYSTVGGTLYFDPAHHIQRAGLLLLNGNIYVAFAPVFGETQNGWVMEYNYSYAPGFTQTAVFNTTPFGTGGGIWESGAGLASDGTYLYVPTGNGTFDLQKPQSPQTEYGDSLLKLNTSLSLVDYFTPSDYQTRCPNTADLDFGSGGVMLIPDPISSNYPSHLMVNAEKESYIWVLNRDSLGGVNGSGLVEQSLQPSPPPLGSSPGYWSSAAYWKYSVGTTTYFQIYYAPDDQNVSTGPPLPLSMYTLNQSPPIIRSPAYSTATQFCGNPHAPTPSISADGNTQNTGLLWAIESSNKSNVPPNPTCGGTITSAILHAYDATTLIEKYNSADVPNIGNATNFGVPTIFNGKVYMGTKSEVDVFVLCTVSPSTCTP